MPYSKDDWRVIFTLDTNIPPRYICITDQGTVGLTGRTIVPKEELDRLQKEKSEYYQKERWAKFEALSYPNIDPIGRGSRGQGKWMFIGASGKKTIFYDTLRKDGVYRLGAWLGENQLIRNPPEGLKAKQLLQKTFPSLEPLQQIGTRVIILSPKKELWNGFLPLKNSDIMRYIGETWWELILDKKEIIIRWRGDEVKVRCPKYYEDTYIKKMCIHEWWIENQKLNWKKNPDAKIVELMILYSKEKIPKEYRGISIQRNGMKICNFDVGNMIPIINKEMAEHIYGWIKLCDEAEKELRVLEDPTHYDFSASFGSFGYFMFGKNGWLAKEILKFGEQKLGLGRDDKKLERLDILVANKLNKYFRKYYQGVKLVKTVPPHNVTDAPSRKRKKIRIKMPKPTFPSEETRKINFGESVTNIQYSIVNETESSKTLRTSLVLKTASKILKERILLKFVSDKIITIKSGAESELFGPYNVTFDKERFHSGTYVLEAEVVLLEGDVLDDQYGKGSIIDQDRELIYLNVEPPSGKGLLEFIDRIEFEDDKELQYRVREKDEKIRIEINIGHPAYKYSEELDNLLEKRNLYKQYKGDNPLLNYELSIGAEVIANYDIRKEAILIRENKDQFIANREEDENAFFIEAVDQANRIAQRIRYDLL